jgi:hypothetical protein
MGNEQVPAATMRVHVEIRIRQRSQAPGADDNAMFWLGCDERDQQGE